MFTKNDDTMIAMFMGFIDRHGNPVKRTKFSHPYTYDTFVVWKNPNPVCLEQNTSSDSDRLYSWDYEKYNKCCQEIWNNHGQHFDCRKPEDIQKFLRLYYQNDTIILNMVEEWCNQSNGFPGWTLSFSYNGEVKG